MADVAEGDSRDTNHVASTARKAFDDIPWPRMIGYLKLLFKPISLYLC